MPTWQYFSDSEAETDRLGRMLADSLIPGMTISLVGNLGAGKTRLTSALAAGLGIPSEVVTSPTFMLIQEYEGRMPLYHFDTYRLKNLDEFYDLGPEEYFYSDGVCLVEWGDRVREALPEDYLRIEIEIVSPTSRRFQFEAFGPDSQHLLESLRDNIDSSTH
ncbi:MAG TPA: tRNA (adenosine(37)-N6)-threonylcarbamoyltransferase complex ATPase subunit type 1 TsaE [Planctomycetaceae bacterium]|nr:tRNA (adenosine(37)-N6)-threonylcarbamoyltransferase complex ATPase subunit type 1 TsaE [Planctomycetaceae bacterium]